jgi:hypothetical protein
MNIVKLVGMTLIAFGTTLASDFSIEIGSPTAAISPNGTAVAKIKAAAFSVRLRGCANPQLSGIALSESSMKQRTEPLVFSAGSATDAFIVTRTNIQVYGAWVAVVTAECGENKLGVLVPVSAQGVYDRSAAKFVPHAPTPMEMEQALRAMKGGSR